ncbi:MAG: hypothetical protein AAGA48_32550 [Myxococcota bacterium]
MWLPFLGLWSVEVYASPQQLRDRLSASKDADGDTETRFIGLRWPSGFFVHRTKTGFRNAFQPNFLGWYRPTSRGSRMYILAVLHPIVLAFTSFMLYNWWIGVTPERSRFGLVFLTLLAGFGFHWPLGQHYSTDS